MKKRLATLLLGTLLCAGAQAAERPVVLELFTSQGCDSCPPAEKFLTQLAADPTLLPLSFHVDYWDYIGWKDAFSLKASTDRQYMYAALNSRKSVFTPQMVIDGRKSVIGSREGEVKSAIDAARENQANLPLTITAANGKLTAHIPAAGPADIVVIRFQRHASTIVKSGENKGRTLDSVNNVTAIEKLGTTAAKPQELTLAATPDAESGLAILIQQPADGRILAAATYIGQ